MRMTWDAWLAVVIFGWVAVLVWAAIVTPTHAQARPYVAYPVYAGCLYITPQGYAVIGQMVPGGTCQ